MAGNYNDDVLVKGIDTSDNDQRIAAKQDGAEWRLAVDSKAVVSPSDAPGCPVLSNKVRVDWSGTEISLNPSTQPYTTLYSYNGSGKLGSVVVDFDSDNVYCRLTIDGEEIFDIDCAILDEIFDGSKDDPSFPFGWLKWNRAENVICFCPPCPVAYSSSILVEARANSNTSSRDMERYLISLTKET